MNLPITTVTEKKKKHKSTIEENDQVWIILLKQKISFNSWFLGHGNSDNSSMFYL